MRGTYLSGVASALQKLAQQVKVQRMLELGCGTGRSGQGIAELLQPPCLRYGLDFSTGMLAQAQQFDPTYRLIQASAPAPPFAYATFDLIFCVHAFHHFPDKPQVIRVAYQLLRPGGAFAIVNIDPRETGQTWAIYDYFEGVYETDLQRFPALNEQEAMLRQAGFRQVNSPIVQYIEDEVSGEAIFEDYYLRKDSSSQLILLSVEAYQAGLQRMRDDITAAKAAGEMVVFRTLLKNRMCHGFKPY
jgi:ubiquinone/menaquinone biosynthesis C-methylase UbiE